MNKWTSSLKSVINLAFTVSRPCYEGQCRIFLSHPPWKCSFSREWCCSSFPLRPQRWVGCPLGILCTYQETNLRQSWWGERCALSWVALQWVLSSRMLGCFFWRNPRLLLPRPPQGRIVFSLLTLLLYW